MSSIPTAVTKPASRRGRHRAAAIPYGQRFNHCLVLGGAPLHADGHQQVLCLCDCGNLQPFTVKLSHLKSGKTKSCGHLKGRNFFDFWTRRAAELPIEKVRAIFNAVAAQKFSENSFKTTARSLKVNISIIRPALERCKLWLQETYGEEFASRFNPSFAPGEKISKYERQYLRQAVTLVMPVSEPLEIRWEDFDTYEQEKLLMTYHFALTDEAEQLAA